MNIKNIKSQKARLDKNELGGTPEDETQDHLHICLIMLDDAYDHYLSTFLKNGIVQWEPSVVQGDLDTITNLARKIGEDVLKKDKLFYNSYLVLKETGELLIEEYKKFNAPEINFENLNLKGYKLHNIEIVGDNVLVKFKEGSLTFYGRITSNIAKTSYKDAGYVISNSAYQRTDYSKIFSFFNKHKERNSNMPWIFELSTSGGTKASITCEKFVWIAGKNILRVWSKNRPPQASVTPPVRRFVVTRHKKV